MTRHPRTSQSDVGQLEDPAEKRQVTGGEDEGDNTDIRGGRSARLLPLHVMV